MTVAARAAVVGLKGGRRHGVVVGTVVVVNAHGICICMHVRACACVCGRNSQISQAKLTLSADCNSGHEHWLKATTTLGPQYAGELEGERQPEAISVCQEGSE